MSITPEGGGEFVVDDRLREFVLTFGREIGQEAFTLIETHFALSDEQVKKIAELFVETIKDVVKNVKFVPGISLNDQSKDSEFWKSVIILLRSKLSSVEGLSEEKVQTVYHYFYEVSTRKCCPSQESDHIL